jgi:hypothetical protein
MGKNRKSESGKWRNGEVAKWGNGEMGREEEQMGDGRPPSGWGEGSKRAGSRVTAVPFAQTKSAHETCEANNCAAAPLDAEIGGRRINFGWDRTKGLERKEAAVMGCEDGWARTILYVCPKPPPEQTAQMPFTEQAFWPGLEPISL